MNDEAGDSLKRKFGKISVGDDDEASGGGASGAPSRPAMSKDLTGALLERIREDLERSREKDWSRVQREEEQLLFEYSELMHFHHIERRLLEQRLLKPTATLGVPPSATLAAHAPPPPSAAPASAATASSAVRRFSTSRRAFSSRRASAAAPARAPPSCPRTPDASPHRAASAAWSPAPCSPRDRGPPRAPRRPWPARPRAEADGAHDPRSTSSPSAQRALGSPPKPPTASSPWGLHCKRSPRACTAITVPYLANLTGRGSIARGTGI